VGFEETVEFIDKAVLPYVDVLSIGLSEYIGAKKQMKEYELKPSDSIHVAKIESYGLQALATEDEDFDRVGIKRIWVKT